MSTMLPSVPTAAQIAAFQQGKESWLESLVDAKVLEGEKDIAGLLLLMTQQNAALYQALTGRPSPAPAPALTPQVVISVGFKPTEINEILVSTPAARAYVLASANQFPLLVAAGGSASLAVPVPQGYVVGTLGDIYITPSDTGAAITAQASIDGQPLVGTFGFTFGPGATMPGGQYLYAQSTGLTATFTNPSAADVTLWISFVTLVIAASFYRGYIAASQNAAYQAVLAALNLST